ncbi:GtrA family protein [Actinoplanes aureus]|uniref:GtrA family protein n=1 Tax=Actinoplanes aureus TaxID=2792083 RepID=A0A931CAM2_9ACTN|nr:GtrA family protein [Actinoplanes aureus]MBG0565204.1 GtrA family protein [Actinoplanes aureus]
MGTGARRLWEHSAVRFLLVGGLSYAFDVGVLVLLHGVLGMPLALATSVSFMSALLVNFGLNRVFAFQSTSLVGTALLRYLVLVLVNYVTTLLLVTGLTALGLSYVVSKTVATILNAVMNYEAYRRWVFRT